MIAIRAMKIAELVWKMHDLDPDEKIDGLDMIEFRDKVQDILTEHNMNFCITYGKGIPSGGKIFSETPKEIRDVSNIKKWKHNEEQRKILELIISMTTGSLLSNGVDTLDTFTSNLRMLADHLDLVDDTLVMQFDK